MNDLGNYPKQCRKSIRKIMHMLSTDAETSYKMIRMTAMLMDLNLDDERVVFYIMMDCGIEDAYMEVMA